MSSWSGIIPLVQYSVVATPHPAFGVSGASILAELELHLWVSLSQLRHGSFIDFPAISTPFARLTA